MRLFLFACIATSATDWISASLRRNQIAFITITFTFDSKHSFDETLSKTSIVVMLEESKNRKTLFLFQARIYFP